MAQAPKHTYSKMAQKRKPQKSVPHSRQKNRIPPSLIGLKEPAEIQATIDSLPTPAENE